MFEEKLSEVLNSEAPIKIIQRRKQFKNWVSETVKCEMMVRDNLRNRLEFNRTKKTGSHTEKPETDVLNSLGNPKINFLKKKNIQKLMMKKIKKSCIV